MIDCKQLDDYLDGDCSSADAEAFQRHCQTCEACRTAVEVEKESTHLMRQGWQALGLKALQIEPSTSSTIARDQSHETSRSKASVTDRSRSSGAPYRRRFIVQVTIAASLMLGLTMLGTVWWGFGGRPLLSSNRDGNALGSTTDQAIDAAIPNFQSDQTELESEGSFVTEVSVDEDHLVITSVQHEDFTLIEVFPVISTRNESSLDKESGL